MKYIAFFSILLLLVSCTDRRVSNYSLDNVPIIIDINLTKRILLTDDHIKHIRYIPLETTDESLIGFPNKTLIRNNRIYIGCFSVTQTLFVFDMEGNFLFRIAQRGQGPEEYISFNDFDVRPNGDIYMYDPFTKRFLIFNSEGKFQRAIQANYFFCGFSLIGDNKMYLASLRASGRMLSALSKYNIERNESRHLFKDRVFLQDLRISGFTMTPHHFFYSPVGIVYFSPMFSPIIYSISEIGVKPAIGVKNLTITPQRVIDSWVREENPMRRSKMMFIENRYFVENMHIFENNTYITFVSRGGALGQTIVYNKHDEIAYEIFALQQLIGIDRIRGSTGEDFFGVAELDIEHNAHIIEAREELRSWQEDDNPVIVILNFNL